MDLSNLLELPADFSEAALDGSDPGDLFGISNPCSLFSFVFTSLRTFTYVCVCVLELFFYG